MEILIYIMSLMRYNPDEVLLSNWQNDLTFGIERIQEKLVSPILDASVIILRRKRRIKRPWMQRGKQEKILVDLLTPIITNTLMLLSLNGQGPDLHDILSLSF